MTHVKTFKYQLKLTPTQERKVDSWIGTCRFAYNLALETKIYAYRSYGANISVFDLHKQLTELKKDCDWIKAVPAQTLQDAIDRMGKAYQSFFRGGGFPRFARKDRYNSILFKSVKIDNHNRVTLPKIGSVKYFNSRPLTGQLRNATITRVNGKYYISIVTKQEENQVSLMPNDSQVGIDMGVSFWASLSTGTQIENPKHTNKYASQLRLESRKLARMKKGSNNRTKQKLIVAKLHEKIRNIRTDFIHKQTTNLVNSFGLIAIEDLKIKNMTRSAKGNTESHGSNVKAKSGLNRSLIDVGFNIFKNQLEYKAAWYGRECIKVDPKYTSQICNSCGVKDKESRISQAKYVCTSCGIESNADVNAAKNILDRALSNHRQRETLVCA